MSSGPCSATSTASTRLKKTKGYGSKARSARALKADQAAGDQHQEGHEAPAAVPAGHPLREPVREAPGGVELLHHVAAGPLGEQVGREAQLQRQRLHQRPRPLRRGQHGVEEVAPGQRRRAASPVERHHRGGAGPAVDHRQLAEVVAGTEPAQHHPRRPALGRAGRPRPSPSASTKSWSPGSPRLKMMAPAGTRRSPSRSSHPARSAGGRAWRSGTRSRLGGPGMARRAGAGRPSRSRPWSPASSAW